MAEDNEWKKGKTSQRKNERNSVRAFLRKFVSKNRKKTEEFK